MKKRLVTASLVLLAPAALLAEPFVFVALPDTQIYSENRFPGDGREPVVTDERGTMALFFDQTEWIVANAQARGIRYVGHLGDIVQNGGNLDEWARAKDAMDLLLQADLPHGTVMGNHDDNHGDDYQRNYLDHFGPQVFVGRPWYSASSPGGGANLQLLEHEGMKLGFINFSIDQPQAEIDWAQEIVADNRDTLFIVGTHRYLYDFKLTAGRYGETVDSPVGELVIEDNFENGVVEPNGAQEFFDEFVSAHPNILMVHAGHFHAEWLRLDDTNAGAQQLIQILTDYQCSRNGGEGWLRVYEMDFKKGTFSFETYSPTLDRNRSVIDHYVETINLVWAERGQVMELLGIADDETYLLILGLLLGDRPDVPDGFLLEHPDLDEPEEQAYYEQMLSDLFLGDIPEDFQDITRFEALWLEAFAANPDDPYDFSDWVRSPGGSFDVDYSAYLAIVDPDGDGLADGADNCREIANADQIDSDGDGIGNACDADLDNDCLVNFLDLDLIRTAFYTSESLPGWNPAADFNGDGTINFADLARMRGDFKRDYGDDNPSGVPNICQQGAGAGLRHGYRAANEGSN